LAKIGHRYLNKRYSRDQTLSAAQHVLANFCKNGCLPETTSSPPRCGHPPPGNLATAPDRRSAPTIARAGSIMLSRVVRSQGAAEERFCHSRGESFPVMDACRPIPVLPGRPSWGRRLSRRAVPVFEEADTLR
jgi:hypothetical protein